MARTVGSRELKTRLGTYLRMVRAGRTIVVTDRGIAVAELRPLYAAPGDLQAVLENMAARGEVTLPRRKGSAARRSIRVLRGPPVSETIAEGREDRM
jgi:antitoxin (DNA-binding transcriptional repressor) of toxin-antitoxin stability system